MENIIYLFGSGATSGELQLKFKYQDNPTSVTNIAKNVLEKSQKNQGNYWKIIDNLEITGDEYIDIETLISLFEFGEVKKKKFRHLADELRKLYREYLIEKTCIDIDPILTKILLKIHKDYCNEMGASGERLLGIITTNYDDLIEKSFCDKRTYQGLNYSYPFESEKYECNVAAPFLLKLHGSFNWSISEKELRTIDVDPKIDNTNGWVPPSIFKNPENEYIFDSIWNLAEHFLRNCDLLRVVGCNLRNEDFALLGLIFRCQQSWYEKGKSPFSIQLIIPQNSAERMIERLPFLVKFEMIDKLLSQDNYESYQSHKKPNPYHIWINDIIEKISVKNPNVLNEDLWIELENLK